MVKRDPARCQKKRPKEKKIIEVMPKTLFQMIHPLELVFEMNLALRLQWPVFDDCTFN